MLRKVMSFGFTLLLFGAFAVPSALAMEPMITFKTNQPIEVPGHVIGPGKYQIVNITPNSGTPVIDLVNSKDRSLGFYQMQDVQRMNTPGRVIVKMQPERDSLARLKEFFVPDSNIGYKFEYPQQKPLA
jgi:hypothetical protein